jgi:hypothetical protein
LRTSDVEDFSTFTLSSIEEALSQCGRKVFVKLSQKSAKKGIEGLKPCHTVLEVFNLLTSSREIALRTGNYEFEFVVICPWIDFNRANEWRVFLRNREIIGISQQNCYTQYGKRNVEKQIERIIEYDFSHFPYEEATLDLAIIDGIVHIFEVNPPTNWCSSGSSLFSIEVLSQSRNFIPVLIY